MCKIIAFFFKEYLNQFTLVSKANNWGNEKKMIAFATSLRDKARAVLDNFLQSEPLTFQTLVEKLEICFGKEIGSNSYFLFQNRRQKAGEDLPTLVYDVEKLSILAYPKCPSQVRDKIACAQFITSIYDMSLKEILPLEGITSLKLL